MDESSRIYYQRSRPLFSKRVDVLPQDLAKSRSREILFQNHRIDFGNSVAEMPVKFQSDWNSLNPNLTVSRLHEILR